ncbi:MAG: hypothetical protein HZC29_08135 [Thaumarchaeota archaeon]|nr:hypothetical protein [Nitrososphaerota archaeon]
MLSSKRSHLRNTRVSGDVFLNKLIAKKNLMQFVESLAEKNNPTLLSIMKVESLFKEHIEFDSRSQLLRKLDGTMKSTILNTIIAYLTYQDKIVINKDHSLTWIDTQGNEKLNREFAKASKF